MPRSNRPRHGGHDRDEDEDLSYLLVGWRRTELKRDGAWNVQPVSAAKAQKSYVCPACRLPVAPGAAHVVTWKADALLGDAAALAERRHWHTHCWRIH